MGPSDHACLQEEAPLSILTYSVLCTPFWNPETKGPGADTVTGDGTESNYCPQPSESAI